MRSNQNRIKIVLFSTFAFFIGFGINYLYNIMPAEVYKHSIEVALTHPGWFRKLGFIDCQTRIIKAIRQSQKSIYVQAYSWTSIPIAKALIEAHKRGVSVSVILDKENEVKNLPAMQLIMQAGIEVRIRRISGLSHNKIMIIDKETVITGSYNFTNAANERNDENLLIIYNPSIAKEYLKHWRICYDESFKVGHVREEKLQPWLTKEYQVNDIEVLPKLNPLKDLQLHLKTKPPQLSVTSDLIPNSILWIATDNLDPYMNIILGAIQRGVETKVLVNLNAKARNSLLVDKLKDNKVPIKFVKIAGNICISDNQVVMTKAYNKNKLFNYNYSKQSYGDTESVKLAKEAFLSLWNSGSDS